MAAFSPVPLCRAPAIPADLSSPKLEAVLDDTFDGAKRPGGGSFRRLGFMRRGGKNASMSSAGVLEQCRSQLVASRNPEPARGLSSMMGHLGLARGQQSPDTSPTQTSGSFRERSFHSRPGSFRERSFHKRSPPTPAASSSVLFHRQSKSTSAAASTSAHNPAREVWSPGRWWHSSPSTAATPKADDAAKADDSPKPEDAAAAEGTGEAAAAALQDRHDATRAEQTEHATSDHAMSVWAIRSPREAARMLRGLPSHAGSSRARKPAASDVVLALPIH